MGMYHDVKYKAMPCPMCNELVKDWQSKDDTLEPLYCNTVLPVVVRNFYGFCVECNTYVKVSYTTQQDRFKAMQKNIAQWNVC